MSKFLLLCITICVFCVALIAFTGIDHVAFLKVGDYILESSVFTLIGFLILTIFALIAFLKTVFLIFDLPYLIKKKWHIRQEQKINQSILQSLVYLLLQDQDKAYDLVKKLDIRTLNINKQFADLLTLILARSSQEIEQSIIHYKSLTENAEYRFLALKALAEILYQHQLFTQSLQYANQAININDKDEKIIEILLYCYAKTSDWEKFDYFVTKLQKVDHAVVTLLAEDIAEFYIRAAKELLEQSNTSIAEGYIMKALAIKPDFVPAIDLYAAINVTNSNKTVILEMLEAAFKAKPCFEIAEIYTKTADLPAETIYQNLANLVPPNDYTELFLALSAYLGLPNTIKHFKQEESASPALLQDSSY